MIVNFAERAHNHNWSLDPIIRSLLDVDFYMQEDNGKLTFSDTAIHKVNGKMRFNYKKVRNYWERVKVGS